MFQPLSEQEEAIASTIVQIAFNIHKELGPGLLERVYEECFCYELEQRNIDYGRQLYVPINYKGLIIDEGLRLDLLVANCVVVELKAQENFHPVWQAQLHSYMKLTRQRLGFLINFHVPLIKDGIKRIIH